MSDPVYDYSTARGYVQSAYLIATNNLRLTVDNDASFVMSIHMLFGFSVELYLKSFLRKKGVDDKTLRSQKVRHGLNALLQLAEGHGMKCTSAKSLANYLNDGHAGFDFRYLKAGKTFNLESMTKLFDWLGELDQFVDQEIGARSAHGLQSDGTWILPENMGAWRT